MARGQHFRLKEGIISWRSFTNTLTSSSSGRVNAGQGEFRTPRETQEFILAWTGECSAYFHALGKWDSAYEWCLTGTKLCQQLNDRCKGWSPKKVTQLMAHHLEKGWAPDHPAALMRFNPELLERYVVQNRAEQTQRQRMSDATVQRLQTDMTAMKSELSNLRRTGRPNQARAPPQQRSQRSGGGVANTSAAPKVARKKPGKQPLSGTSSARAPVSNWWATGDRMKYHGECFAHLNVLNFRSMRPCDCAEPAPLCRIPVPWASKASWNFSEASSRA